ERPSSPARPAMVSASSPSRLATRTACSRMRSRVSAPLPMELIYTNGRSICQASRRSGIGQQHRVCPLSLEMDDEALEGPPIARVHAKQKLARVGVTMHIVGLVSTTAEGGELRHRIESDQGALPKPHGPPQGWNTATNGSIPLAHTTMRVELGEQ